MSRLASRPSTEAAIALHTGLLNGISRLIPASGHRPAETAATDAATRMSLARAAWGAPAYWLA